ncbi:MAG: hypothetical protein ACRKFN_10335 [Desulfitobacterium sp.]
MVDEEEGYRKIRRMPSRCLGTEGLSQSREVICGTKGKHQGTGAVCPFGLIPVHIARIVQTAPKSGFLYYHQFYHQKVHCIIKEFTINAFLA